ncbi:MAG: 3-deoxy-D-manno-octulosonic acid transferase [Simkaniaceae bacterium]|jgi:3-deoxy-D-manno-octulosonic-acid transferase|nr:MAG: 3-deoxy-D-manno-octulosonic acid transferase [Simkaniaceae bacterium]
MTFLYDFALYLLLILSFPKLLIDYLFKGKYRKSLFARISPEIPKDLKKPLIWLHAVSMGETKALSTLIPHIRKTYPNAYIYVTTVTETGQEEAQKRISDADAIGYLPLDFSWIIKGFVRKLKPALLILVEGDYWFNLINQVKKQGAKIIVVNGKLSEKSMKRYLAAPFFSRSIFNSIDHFCIQGESYLERFLKLGIHPENLIITGNLKFDIPSDEEKDLEALKKQFDIKQKDRVITLGSTHEGEEELLYKSLIPALTMDPHLKILIVPRHPERFSRVKSLIHHPQIRIVDQMGILPKCYHLSHLAIVGGSFIKGVGGHDIFEPAKMGVPTLYGPYMHKQVDLDRGMTESGAGIKVEQPHLLEAVEKLLNDSKFHFEMGKKGKYFAHKVMGASFRTWKEITSNISLEKN